MSINLCTVTGIVLRVDGSAFANGEVTFASTIPQVVQGTVIPITTLVATTDASGNLNGGAGVSLIQGLAMTVALSQNGNFNSQFTCIVPNVASTSFASIATGVLGLNPAAFVTGTFTPFLSTNGGTNPTVTYTLQAGYYVEIGGSFVMANALVNWSAQSGGAGSQIGIGGLPFSVATLGQNFTYGGVQLNAFTLTAGFTWVVSSPQQGTTFMALVECGSGQVGAYVAYSQAPTGAGVIDATFVYRTT